MQGQTCPKCKSKNIRIANSFSKLGDPILTQGLVGWECLDCGYMGKDFFIRTKNKIKNSNNKGSSKQVARYKK